MTKIAILGFGTVGTGVYEVIRKNRDSITRKCGGEIDIKYILDIRDFSTHEESHLFVSDYNIILNDPEVSIVVEVIGGLMPAYEFTKQALLCGKSVVTSNKELVATHGSELLKIAKDIGVSYLFEASVGGGIPIIMPMHQCLAANEISEIVGILNGTTNYILTQMIKEGQSFLDALSDAQAKGYAEKNPTADVEGHDTCRKIAILSSLAFGSQVEYSTILTEGITKITLIDVDFVDKMGYVIKLIGHSKKVGDRIMARVCPMLIPRGHSLSVVDDVFNAIVVKGDAIGDVMFYGRGAGKLPTASAVVSDIIDITRHNIKPIIWSASKPNFVINVGEYRSRFFIRANGIDDTMIKSVFGDVEIIALPHIPDQLGFITECMSENELAEKLKNIQGVCRIIRILDND